MPFKKCHVVGKETVNPQLKFWAFVVSVITHFKVDLKPRSRVPAFEGGFGTNPIIRCGSAESVGGAGAIAWGLKTPLLCQGHVWQLPRGWWGFPGISGFGGGEGGICVYTIWEQSHRGAAVTRRDFPQQAGTPRWGGYELGRMSSCTFPSFFGSHVHRFVAPCHHP